jgi:hypothetical protein
VPAPTLPTGVIPASGVYLSDFLLESVKRRTRMPVSQATLDTWDVLRIADEQIRGYVAPLMISVAEDYLTAEYDVPITADVTSYRPPARSMKLREVQFLDANGDPVDVPRIAIEELPYASWGFYLLGESVKIVNVDQVAGLTLRLTYYLRPSKLIPASEAGVVSGVVGGAISLYATPAGIGTGTVDLVRGVAPFEVVAQDVACTVAGGVVTVAAASIPDGFGAGDFVCLPQECPGVQVHPDLFALVAQATAVAILDGNGDDAAYQRAERELAKLDGNARILLAQRVEGEPIPLGGHSPLWDRGWGGGRR